MADRDQPKRWNCRLWSQREVVLLGLNGVAISCFAEMPSRCVDGMVMKIH